MSRRSCATARREDGWRWLQVRCEPELDARGDFVGVVGTLADVTRRAVTVRRAIGAAEVAPVHDRDAQVPERPVQAAAPFVYALLSLTVVRMVPVAVSLIGSGLARSTVLFMGWFGPRGLASIVLGLVYLEHGAQQPGGPTIRLAVMVTVLLSILAHELSARPGINFCAMSIAA